MNQTNSNHPAHSDRHLVRYTQWKFRCSSLIFLFKCVCPKELWCAQRAASGRIERWDWLPPRRCLEKNTPAPRPSLLLLNGSFTEKKVFVLSKSNLLFILLSSDVTKPYVPKTFSWFFLRNVVQVSVLCVNLWSVRSSFCVKYEVKVLLVLFGVVRASPICKRFPFVEKPVLPPRNYLPQSQHRPRARPVFRFVKLCVGLMPLLNFKSS